MDFNNTALDYPQFLFCGSFRPIHAGHIAIADYIYNKWKVPVDFEISVNNVEKGTITLDEVKQRAYVMIRNKRPSFGKLYVSDDARYLEKARYLPGVTFVCGFDTFAALCSGMYYKCGTLSEAIKEFKDLGVKWLVFPRIHEGKLWTKEDCKDFPPEIMEDATFVEDFTPMDISSRKLRGEA